MHLGRLLLIFSVLGLSQVAGRADLPAQLEAVVDQKMAETGVPGVLMGVWRGDTEVTVLA